MNLIQRMFGVKEKSQIVRDSETTTKDLVQVDRAVLMSLTPKLRVQYYASNDPKAICNDPQAKDFLNNTLDCLIYNIPGADSLPQGVLEEYTLHNIRHIIESKITPYDLRQLNKLIKFGRKHNVNMIKLNNILQGGLDKSIKAYFEKRSGGQDLSGRWCGCSDSELRNDFLDIKRFVEMIGVKKIPTRTRSELELIAQDAEKDGSEMQKFIVRKLLSDKAGMDKIIDSVVDNLTIYYRERVTYSIGVVREYESILEELTTLPDDTRNDYTNRIVNGIVTYIGWNNLVEMASSGKNYLNNLCINYAMDLKRCDVNISPYSLKKRVKVLQKKMKRDDAYTSFVKATRKMKREELMRPLKNCAKHVGAFFGYISNKMKRERELSMERRLREIEGDITSGEYLNVLLKIERIDISQDKKRKYVDVCCQNVLDNPQKYNWELLERLITSVRDYVPTKLEDCGKAFLPEVFRWIPRDTLAKTLLYSGSIILEDLQYQALNVLEQKVKSPGLHDDLAEIIKVGKLQTYKPAQPYLYILKSLNRRS